jgi:hypothetical protein
VDRHSIGFIVVHRPERFGEVGDGAIPREVTMAGPHITLYEDVNCSGREMDVFEPLSYVGDKFNDITSSFVILEGTWAFFKDANFQGQLGTGGNVVLGPGTYNWIEDALGPGSNDTLSSLRPV